MRATISNLTLIAGTMAAIAAWAAPAQAQSAVFADLAGRWTGAGSVQLKDGASERIRCRAHYDVSGATLSQNLTCASDSYRFELRSNVVAKGAALSGSWSETSRNISGDLTGRASPGGRYDVTVSGPAFMANLALNVQGRKQIVQIRSQGEFRGVTITMTKS